jgi:Xaa-Pro aminopeptidase
MLTLAGCKIRLDRFRAALDQHGIDLAVLSNYRSVYYLCGHLREVELPQLLIVTADGNTILITDSQPAQCAAAEVSTYEDYSADWPKRFAAITVQAARTLKAKLAKINAPVRRIAMERDRLSAALLDVLVARWPNAEQVDAVVLIDKLRKSKDPDEIELISRSIRAVEAGYTVARQVIRPGASELDVFKEVHGEIVRHAGYNLQFHGDFACGIRAIKEGGTPLPRQVQPGDLYMLDIFPSFHGYHGDLCRTFAASRPTELQRDAWTVIRNALRLAEEKIRPGVLARDVWKQLREYIDSFEFVRGSFWHHAGHGVGLDPHEPPWIFPAGDDVFEIGDVIALEPACYGEHLQGGVRLECDYVVRENALENLSRFPLEL